MKNKWTRGAVLLLLCVFPGFLFIKTWQAYRFDQLENQTRLLEEEQDRWYELNKRLATRITEQRSPDKVEAAAEDLEMEEGAQGGSVHIILRNPGDRADD